MINGRKTIGLIMCGVTGNYQKDLCRSITISAKNRGYNLIVFNLVGIIGKEYHDYGRYENHFIDIIPFEKLDGVIFDNNNVVIQGIADRVYSRLEQVSCPAIMLGFPTEKYYEIHFDNRNGFEEMVDHFVKVHGFTKIGYMSGIEGHVDAVERLKIFREAMKRNGLPEDGVGVFHGDFWYNKGREAADFFWNKCKERPQAVICANDFMAMSLSEAFVLMGIKVPEQIRVSGCDGVYEAMMHCPGITTIDKDTTLLSERAMDIIETVNSGGVCERVNILPTTNRYRASCGCLTIEEDDQSYKANESFAHTLNYLYYIYDTESAMLEMNRIDKAEEIEEKFARYGVNIGGYDKFMVYVYVDEEGNKSYEKEILAPTQKVYPALWIDKSGTTVRPEKYLDLDTLLPEDTDEDPQCIFLSHIHFSEHCFGYSVIKMVGDEPFNEFYKIWTVNIAVSFETLLHKNSIRTLVRDLEKESTHDRLTGLLNRRGFEQQSEKIFSEACKDPDKSVAAVMIDMDRLKAINDDYGHAEGDYAIKALADIIQSCCTDGAIAGRTGGDEFYVLAVGYDKKQAELFSKRLELGLAKFNSTADKEYKLNASCGYSVKKVSEINRLEDLLKLSDEKMYKAKRKKYKDVRYR